MISLDNNYKTRMPDNFNVSRTDFSNLVLSELFEFAQSPSRDEFLDVIGYFTPTMLFQQLPPPVSLSIAIEHVLLAIEKVYAFRKYILEFDGALLASGSEGPASSFNAHQWCQEWQMKNSVRGKAIIPMEEIVLVLRLFIGPQYDLHGIKEVLSTAPLFGDDPQSKGYLAFKTASSVNVGR